jgi:mono/diheme cytochrome c family protein
MLRLNLIMAAVALIATGSSLNAQDAKLIARGQALVAEHRCAMCHTIATKGGKLSKSLDGVSERRDAAALTRILTDPQKEFPDAKIKMPKVAWQTGEVAAVVAYPQTLKVQPAK